MKVKDHMLSQEEFELVFDDALQCYRTVPVPEDLSPYYESDKYISHTDSSKGIVDWVYQKVKRFQLSQKRSRLLRLVSSDFSLLDVGTGTGDWPVYLQERGHKVHGLETSSAARKMAMAKGIEVYSSWEELKNKSFQVITMWHVLEHLEDPSESLRQLSDCLEPGGVLLIAVPNFRSYDAKKFGAYWAAYDVPRHLWHFSSKTIQRLGEGAGLVWIRKWPMWFDVFYVSLLSEKYKPNSNLLHAAWVAFRSTLSALRTNEHSSMLYALQKPEKAI